MKLGIIGCGAIDSDVSKAAEDIDEIEKIYLFDIDKKAEQNLCKTIKKAEIKPVGYFLEKVDVVFEAASQQAVMEYAECALKAG
ncbi:MAG: aspartate dehydrogenase, partial [Thermoplasmatales archaeon]|nr:aspartate dehydrogenase [Thermoplasmatales archaeon]